MTKNTGKRYGTDVKEKILNKAIKIWEQDATQMTTANVARQLGMNHANIYHHFPDGFKEAVAEYAVKTKNTKIICQLIALGHTTVESLGPSERAEYLSNLHK